MKIAFTGGGTAGHAMVNTILIPYLQERDCHIIYIGSHGGMEKDMVEVLNGVRYHGISTGKLRRYYSKENFKDIFRVAAGFFEAYKILKKEKPQVLYSGGGYVSVPVVLAARSLKIPVLIRETDMSVGLANRLCMPFAEKVFTAFPDTQKQLSPKIHSEYPGVLIRPSLYDSSLAQPISSSGKPLCLIMGGSSGAQRINEAVWKGMEDLTQSYDVIHICGKGNLSKDLQGSGQYRQIEFVYAGMGDLLNAADVVVTRCGSNAVLETMAFGKRMVCIPISNKSSRGEQNQNAAFAVSNGNAIVLEEPHLNGRTLNAAITKVLSFHNETPFQITKKQLLGNITAHVNEIYRIAQKNMNRDFFRSIEGNTTINFNDLSDMELFLYDEIVCRYGNKW